MVIYTDIPILKKGSPILAYSISFNLHFTYMQEFMGNLFAADFNISQMDDLLV